MQLIPNNNFEIILNALESWMRRLPLHFPSASSPEWAQKCFPTVNLDLVLAGYDKGLARRYIRRYT